MNFPKFSESKGILKIGRSEVCVWGGGAEGQTLKSRLPVYNIFSGQEDRVQYWQARWATGQSQWHSDQPHKYLVKVTLCSSKNSKRSLCDSTSDKLKNEI